jgi:hypothetical protein
MKTGSLFAGVKQPERESDNSLLSSAEFKKAWSYTSTANITPWQERGKLYIYLHFYLHGTRKVTPVSKLFPSS